MFVFVWIRGTLLRLRYDQFMVFGWKILIPVALAWVVILATFQWLGQSGVTRTQLIIGIVAVAVVVLAAIWLWPDRKPAAEARRGSTEFDAFAGGYPVPPLPGQTLPRSRRRGATTYPDQHVAPSARSEETR
jgi:NADH-quinone oxidoreductase subunit H